MGDPQRFRIFGDFIEQTWPDRSLSIADVAGGHGRLRADLFRRGYENVVTFDKRRYRWTTRGHYRYGLFDDSVEGFDLIVGMHPDEATDVICDYALRRALPFAVVPCCIKPTAWSYDRPVRLTPRSIDSRGDALLDWWDHLVDGCRRHDPRVERSILPMKGANCVIWRADG
jgi:hypothetical protein